MQSCETQSQWLHLQNTSTLWKRRWKDCKSQRDRESVCPSNIRSCTLKSYRRDCPNVKWTRKIQMDLPNWMGKSPQGLNPMERTVGNRGKVGVVEVVLPSKGISQLVVQCQMVSLETKHTSNIVYTEQVMFKNVCGPIHCTGNNKEAMNLKKSGREWYVRWFRGRKWRGKCNWMWPQKILKEAILSFFPQKFY